VPARFRYCLMEAAERFTDADLDDESNGDP
jgi:hypothetical protein